MKRSQIDRIPLFMAAFLLLTFALAVRMTGQISPTSSTLLLAMGANVKQIVHYGWKQRVTVVRKGKAADPVIDQVRFDSSGQMQRTTLSAPPEKMSGIRGRVAAGVKENVEGIMQLAGQYNKPQQMVVAVKKAQISQSSNAIQIRAADVIKPGDTLNMLANPTTHLASHVDINTNYDGSPMTIAQDYERLPNGPNVMKTMKVSVPGKDLVVNVESYDYTQQNAGLQ